MSLFLYFNKLTLYLGFALCFFAQVFFLPKLQANDVLERRIDVRFNQTPLKNAMAEIARKGGFEWSYNAGIIDADRKVTLFIQGQTVRETLVLLLGDAYTFKQSGEYLILKKIKKPGQRLSGYITEPRNGQKVANATVYDRQTLRSTTTDVNGYYELPVTPRSEIVVSKLAYRDTILQVTSQTPRFLKLEIHLDTVPQEKTPLETVAERLNETTRELERFFVTSTQKLSALNVQDSLHRRFQVSLLPKIGTNHVLSGSVVNDWSVNLLAGYSKGNRIAEVAGIGNITRQNVRGLQAAGVFNDVHGNMTGFQAAGVYNRVADTIQGIQAAGIFNHAYYGRGAALQAAGIANFVTKGRFAIQAAGIANYADTISTLQAAGIFNYASNANAALQAAGICNVNRQGIVRMQAAGISNLGDTIIGLQAAGLVNVADTVAGAQISGFFNRARKVKGAQIGLINVAGDISGLQIGLLNFSRRGGYIALEVSVNEVQSANIAFKSGTPFLYTIFTAGATPGASGRELLWSYGAGLGAYARLNRWSGINVDLIHRHLNAGYHDDALQEWEQCAIGFDLKLSRHLSLAFGPTANLFISDATPESQSIRSLVTPKKVPSSTIDGDERLTAWLGGTAALRFRF